MKKTILALLALTPLALSAATVSFSQIGANNGGSVPGGSTSINYSGYDTNTATGTLTATGLDLDGIGGNNDSITLMFQIQGFTGATNSGNPGASIGNDGSPAAVRIINTSRWNVGGAGGADRFTNGEILRYAYVTNSLSANLGGVTYESADFPSAFSFDGFTGIGGDENTGSNFPYLYEIDGDDAGTYQVVANGGGTDYTFAPSQVLRVGGIPGSDVRVENLYLDVTFDAEAVPEPSTSFLGLAGMLALLVRRRR